MSDPDQLERDVTKTRQQLGSDVDRLNEKASPKTVVTTRVDKLKSGANSVKERLMGAADKDKAKDKAGDLAGTAKDKADALSAKVGDAAGDAPAALRDKAQGNPIAAGLIAFGVGWLVSSLAPASSAEQDAAEKIEANAGTVIDPLKQSAQEVAGNLQQPLQDSAEHLKGKATDAADRTAQHAKSATGDVQDQIKN